MSQQITERLRAIATTVFEDLGLLFVEEGPEAAPEATLAAHARVAFSGTVDGWLEVAVSEGILRELAENMLGTADTPSVEIQLDALGEVANVICGNMVPVLGSESAVPFDLQPPVCVATAPAQGGGNVIDADMGLAEGRAVVRVCMAEPAGAYE